MAHLTRHATASTSQTTPPQPQECAPPLAIRHDKPIPTRPTITHRLHTKDHKIVHLTTLDDDPTLQLTYVHNLLEPQDVEALVKMADDRHGWVRSPLKAQKSGDALHSEIRNSTSCPMLWPLVYGHLRDELAEKRPELLAELELVTAITERVAALFRATGLDSITASYIEPLQLVKYAPSERFGPHHDYHEIGDDGTVGGTSVQGEQRMFTVLIFGATLESGGETHFPHLGIKVSPRLGDAIIWSNLDADGAPNPRSLHEGRPPDEGSFKIAINCWVANREFTQARRLDRAVKT